MGVAIVAACRIIAERAIKIMASQAHRILHGENHIVMRNGAVLPVASRRNPGPGRSEVTLAAFSIQIMTGTTFKGTRTVKSGLIFIQPGLAQGMIVVAIMTRLGTIPRCPVDFVAGGTDRAEFLQLRMGDAAVNPVCARWNPAADRVKMAFRATGHCGAADQVGTMADLAGFSPCFLDLLSMELGRVGGADKLPGMDRSGFRSIAVHIGTA